VAATRIIRAWARGIVTWRPPPALRSEYLVAWAVIFIGLVFAAPYVVALPMGGRAACAAGLVVLAGTVNAAFEALGSG
jgi:hypothetical protein